MASIPDFDRGQFEFDSSFLKDIITNSDLETDPWWTDDASNILPHLIETQFYPDVFGGTDPINNWFDQSNVVDKSVHDSRRPSIQVATHVSKKIFIKTPEKQADVEKYVNGYKHALLLGVPIQPFAWTPESIITLYGGEELPSVDEIVFNDFSHLVQWMMWDVTLGDFDARPANHLYNGDIDQITRIDIHHSKDPIDMYQHLSISSSLRLRSSVYRNNRICNGKPIPEHENIINLIELATWRARQYSQVVNLVIDELLTSEKGREKRFDRELMESLKSHHSRHTRFPITHQDGPISSHTKEDLIDKSWPWDPSFELGDWSQY
jgi:hypothetical protein